MVNEAVAHEQLLSRAWERAERIAQQLPLTVRYARVAFTQQLKRLMLDQLGYGLALEGLGALAYWPGQDKKRADSAAVSFGRQRSLSSSAISPPRPALSSESRA